MNPSTSGLINASKDVQSNSSSGTKFPKNPVHKIVRTDSRDPVGRLHAYFQEKDIQCHEKSSDLSVVRSAIRQRRNPKETADLSSIQELLNDIDSNTHSGLLDIVKDCTYIGMADDVFALLQHSTRLYLVNVVNVSKELMYQQVIRRFAHFNAIQLSDPAPLPDLLLMALKEMDVDTQGDENDDPREKIAEMNTEFLKQKAEMLQEYFCIHIDQQGNLLKLPVVLDQYTPDMDCVPEFLLSLGNDVDWEDEKNCFQMIAAAIGNFYAAYPPLLPNPSGDGFQFYKKNKANSSNIQENEENQTNTENKVAEEDDVDHQLLAEADTAWAQREWTIQHVLFPSMRLFLKPPKAMATNGTFVQIAALEKLYKIFERC
ncbi:hypothetical protein Taro_003440 [Colocasia esculenta]|uniref:DNA mismatch repair protein Mlh1 C-terminal domain-containing protein n=1 Tax=Colocasia esculenta TaxID=4460 RepID=A0A843TLR7_COLES|nr:hypothetical protein [Colocasia esculenta]